MKDKLMKQKSSPSKKDDQYEVPEEVVVYPIEDSLDLHAFRPREVKDLLDDYLEAAHEKGFREVRIIHGKGSGILREKVHSILKKHPLVLSFRLGDSSEGGWGATTLLLRDDSRHSEDEPVNPERS